MEECPCGCENVSVIGMVCLACQGGEILYNKDFGVYTCEDCGRQFTPVEYRAEQAEMDQLERDWKRAAGEEDS